MEQEVWQREAQRGARVVSRMFATAAHHIMCGIGATSGHIDTNCKLLLISVVSRRLLVVLFYDMNNRCWSTYYMKTLTSMICAFFFRRARKDIVLVLTRKRIRNA